MRTTYQLTLLFLTLLLANVPSSIAAPSLSPDGSLLSGVNVNGTLYNIRFTDGVFQTSFPVLKVTEDGWEDLANDVSAAVVNALNGLSSDVAPQDIRGCTSTDTCRLVLIDTYDELDSQLIDNEYAAVGAPEGAYLSNGQAFGPPNATTVGLDDWTLMTFSFADGESPSGILISLEEPIANGTHSGIGNLRGWAISEKGIDRVEIFIDGEYAFDAPYGGSRTDIAASYPDIEDSESSGYSLAYGYSNLDAGQHTVTARAYDLDGGISEDSSTFNVEVFHKSFIPSSDTVDVSNADISADGDELLLEGVEVDGVDYDLTLRWRTSEQGFEIIEIR